MSTLLIGVDTVRRAYLIRVVAALHHVARARQVRDGYHVFDDRGPVVIMCCARVVSDLKVLVSDTGAHCIALRAFASEYHPFEELVHDGEELVERCPVLAELGEVQVGAFAMALRAELEVEMLE